MHRAIALCAGLGLAAAMVAAPTSRALAEPPPELAEAPAAQHGSSANFATKSIDLLIVRPASAAQALLGGAIVLVAYPLSVFSGDQQAVVDIALLGPFRYAFERPLGEF